MVDLPAFKATVQSSSTWDAYVSVTLGSASILADASRTASPAIFKAGSVNLPRRFHRTVYQAKLGYKQDIQKRKILDNNLRLSSHPTDMLRITTIRDIRSGDIQSRSVDSAEVLPILLPVMKDVPLRKFSSLDNKDVLIPSLYVIGGRAYFELYAPASAQLKPEDLLVRLISDPNAPQDPYVLVLQVKEALATISYTSILYERYQATLFDESLNDDIIKAIKAAYAKRIGIEY